MGKISLHSLFTGGGGLVFLQIVKISIFINKIKTDKRQYLTVNDVYLFLTAIKFSANYPYPE